MNPRLYSEGDHVCVAASESPTAPSGAFAGKVLEVEYDRETGWSYLIHDKAVGHTHWVPQGTIVGLRNQVTGC